VRRCHSACLRPTGQDAPLAKNLKSHMINRGPGGGAIGALDSRRGLYI
jgi:hypothetical protein